MTHTFLVINGARLTASPVKTEHFILGLYADGLFDFEHLSQWLRNNVMLEATRN